MKWYERQKHIYAQNKESRNTQETAQTVKEDTLHQAQDGNPQQSTNYDQDGYDASQEQTYAENDHANDEASYYTDSSMNSVFEETFTDADTQQNQMMEDAIYSQQTTIINKGTVIDGDIETDNDLIVYGHIKGDILCNANLSVYGIVEGTINCGNAYLDNAIISGDIGCSGSVELTQNSTIDGNVEAFELLNGGHIKGNATVSEGVRFLSTSVIVGDIQANDIEIERGAVIQGSVTIRQEVYFEG